MTSLGTRHDGWTGEKMAIFCDSLAETAVVAEACDAARMGISGAYACRRRNPVFAAAWDAALTIARERLADTLLARSMEGNIELLWKDGEVVGERHLLDNRLGLAILRRLDRLAETGLSLHSNVPPTSVRPERSRGAPALTSQPFDWALAIDALRTGDEAAVRKALALAEDYEVEEVEDPLNRPASTDDEPEELDLSDRFWKDVPPAPPSGEEPGMGHDYAWMTDFPPPPGFAGYQSGDWDDAGEIYKRECTPEEVALLDGDAARLRAAERAEEEALRDSWFALLKEELDVGAAELQ
jgi:hypothetical protein